jgi:hypothetical protein
VLPFFGALHTEALMSRVEIQPGHSYWIQVGELPQRRVLVDWSCPAEDPQWFYCWDIDTGLGMSLSADDFLRRCDEEVSWAELMELGPEHRPVEAEDSAPMEASHAADPMC